MVNYHQRRETFALNLCPYVPWTEYNWYDIVQCNYVGTGIKIHWNPAVFSVLAASHALSAFLALQIIAVTLMRFKSWRTLYFWAIISASTGLLIEVIAIQLFLFVVKANSKAVGALTAPGGILVKTGFAVVLYSRLHLVLPQGHRLLLRGLLAMIVVIGLTTHVPIIVSIIVSAYGPSGIGTKIYRIAKYFDFGIAVESVLLAGLYIYFFRQYLQDLPQHAPEHVKRYTKRTFRLLIAAYLFELAYEVLVLTLLFKNLVLARNVAEPIFYGAKLGFEFFVLNSLRSVSKMKSEALQRGNISVALAEENDTRVESSPDKNADRAVMNDLPTPSPGHYTSIAGSPAAPQGQDYGVEKSSAIRAYEAEDDISSSNLTNETNQAGLVGNLIHSDLDDLERQYLGRNSTRK